MRIHGESPCGGLLPDVDRLNLEEWGPAFEHHAIFPTGPTRNLLR